MAHTTIAGKAISMVFHTNYSFFKMFDPDSSKIINPITRDMAHTTYAFKCVSINFNAIAHKLVIFHQPIIQTHPTCLILLPESWHTTYALLCVSISFTRIPNKTVIFHHI